MKTIRTSQQIKVARKIAYENKQKEGIQLLLNIDLE